MILKKTQAGQRHYVVGKKQGCHNGGIYSLLKKSVGLVVAFTRCQHQVEALVISILFSAKFLSCIEILNPCITGCIYRQANEVRCLYLICRRAQGAKGSCKFSRPKKILRWFPIYWTHRNIRVCVIEESDIEGVF